MGSLNLLLGLCYLFRLCTIPDEPEVPKPYSILNSFSSKTAYRNSKLEGLKNGAIEENKCKLIHINAIFRHGCRYSSKDDMENIVKVHKKIIQSKTQQGLKKSFVDWKLPFQLNEEKKLTSVGYEEMMLLGQRFRKKFNQIYKNINNTWNIEIFSTSVERAKLSGAAFIQKFFENKISFKEASQMIKENDAHLRFFDNCPHYTKSVQKNNSMKEEYKKFSKGPEAQRVVQEIKAKWNLKDVDLTIDDVRSLYVMCGYEIATNMSSDMLPYKCNISKEDNSLTCPKDSATFENSPLCSLLEPEHYLVFEYLYDLKHYWIKAYGSKINWLQSCELMYTILKQILDATSAHQVMYKYAMDNDLNPEDNKNKHIQYLRGAFWFAHAETILPLSSLLGLFHQSLPLKASNFQHRLKMLKDVNQRFNTFRVSNIAQFSGNIAFELYHCPQLKKEQSGYMIKIKSNEKTMKWSLGNDQGLISLEDLKKHLEMCSPNVYNHYNVCVDGKGI